MSVIDKIRLLPTLEDALHNNAIVVINSLSKAGSDLASLSGACRIEGLYEDNVFKHENYESFDNWCYFAYNREPLKLLELHTHVVIFHPKGEQTNEIAIEIDAVDFANKTKSGYSMATRRKFMPMSTELAIGETIGSLITPYITDIANTFGESCNDEYTLYLTINHQIIK